MSVVGDVHERGGLTKEHWAAIIRRARWVRVRRLRLPKAPVVKIRAYGKMVLAGHFPDRGFHHRRYLGSRHWELILSLFDKAEPAGVAAEIREYALFERAGLYTVDDFLATKRPQAIFYERQPVPWSGELKRLHGKWQGVIPATQEFHEGKGWSTWTEPEQLVEEEYVRETLLSILQKRWLLSGGDIEGDPLEANAETLSRALRKGAAADPERFRRRLWERGEVPWMRNSLERDWQRLRTATQSDAEDEQRRAEFQRYYQAHFGVKPGVSCPSDVEDTFALVEATVSD